MFKLFDILSTITFLIGLLFLTCGVALEFHHVHGWNDVAFMVIACVFMMLSWMLYEHREIDRRYNPYGKH